MKLIVLLFVLFSVILGLASCDKVKGGGVKKFVVISNGVDFTLDFASAELAKFLEETGKFEVTSSIEKADVKFILLPDPQLLTRLLTTHYPLIYPLKSVTTTTFKCQMLRFVTQFTILTICA